MTVNSFRFILVQAKFCEKVAYLYMSDNEFQKSIIIEKYKEVSANRRHYSALRFALLPFYFGIQGAIAQTAYNDKATLPFFVCALAGVLSTYVFWTIEERISDYYNHFEQVGAKLEEELNFGEKMFVNWPKSKFMSNTKRSIRSAYFLCTAFWIVYLCMELIKS